MKLKTGDKLMKEAEKLGFSLSEIGGPINYAELQKRVIEANVSKEKVWHGLLLLLLQ